MGDKTTQKGPVAPPLVSDRIWACHEGPADWKVVGNASVGRMRARSVVGEMGLAKLGVFSWNGSYSTEGQYRRSASVVCESPDTHKPLKKRSMSFSVSLQDETLGYKEMCRDYYRYCGLHEQEDVFVERGTLSSLRRNSFSAGGSTGMGAVVGTVPSSPIAASLEKEAETKKAQPRRKALPKGSKFCLVQFGSGKKCIGIYTDLEVEAGTFVIVEADRGEDCGVVVAARINPNARDEQRPENWLLKRVHRIATEDDRLLLLEQNKLEDKAMASCRERVRSHELEMEIVGAEYQWDRNKLTFYFRSGKRVDFRDLVKELYKEYKTRIWMCAVEKKPVGRK
jgi:PSP1 C-terminal conserved region